MNENDANPTPEPEPGKVLRAASARDIARVIGCNKRTLLRWAAAGCPHDAVERRGQKSASFNIEEVREWMKRQGLDARERGGGQKAVGSGREAVGSGHSAFGKGTRLVQSTGVPHRESVPPDEQAGAGGGEAVDLWSMTFRAPVGDVDLMGPLSRLLDSVDKAINRLTKDATPAELQKIGSAMSDLSTQYRAIRQAEFEHQKRMGAFVPLAEGRRVIREHADAFVNDLQQLRSDVPATVTDALVAAGLIAGDGDTVAKARRVLTPKVSDAIDQARARRAAARAVAEDAMGRAVA